MRSSADEALSLLGKWTEDKTWVLVNAQFQNGVDRLFFWACPVGVSELVILLSGEFVALRLPLDSATFEFADLREAPEPARSVYANFESSLAIKSDRFSVVLMSSASGSPVAIIPPDIIPQE